MEENFNHQLKQRIEAVRTALMYGTLEEGINMPTALTSTIRYEETEDGNYVWLMMKQPWHNIRDRFPVTLQYYQKGVPHKVKVEGAAEVSYLPSNIAVVKVKVEKYEWCDLALPATPVTANNWLTVVQQWFKESVVGVFRPEPAAA